MVIPCLYHLVNFPKLINIGWGVSVIEPKFTGDGVELAFRHELPEAFSWTLLPDNRKPLGTMEGIPGNGRGREENGFV